MQPKTLLFLTLAVLVLGAFIFFYEKDLPSTDERAELAKKVLRVEDDAVDALQIEWNDHKVRLERVRPTATDDDEQDLDDASLSAPDSWRISTPLDARADRDAVEALVSSLADLESSRVLEDFDRAELGLEDPRARVTVITADDQRVLEIGAEVPASSDMVVGVAGQPKAYRVAASLFDDLTKTPGDWRDKKLFTGPRDDIDRVTLDSAAGRVLLARRDGDFWVESPLSDRADEDRVNTLMSEITGLRVKAFLDEPLLAPEGMGLEPPRGTIEIVRSEGEQPFRLELGDPAGEEGVIYGRADGQLFELETQLAETVATTPSEWRSKSWTALQVFKVEAARFEDDEGSVEVSRDGADWKRGSDRIGYTVVSDLLYPITDAKGEQVVERDAAIAQGYALESPALQILLTTKDGEEELALSPAVEGLVAAITAGREAVLLLKEESVGEILDKLQALRDAEPLPEEDGADEPEASASE